MPMEEKCKHSTDVFLIIALILGGKGVITVLVHKTGSSALLLF